MLGAVFCPFISVMSSSVLAELASASVTCVDHGGGVMGADTCACTAICHWHARSCVLQVHTAVATCRPGSRYVGTQLALVAIDTSLACGVATCRVERTRSTTLILFVFLCVLRYSLTDSLTHSRVMTPPHHDDCAVVIATFCRSFFVYLWPTNQPTVSVNDA